MHLVRRKSFLVSLFFCSLVLADGYSFPESDRFDCGDGNSVQSTYQCNGDEDCANGADERNCDDDSSTIRRFRGPRIPFPTRRMRIPHCDQSLLRHTSSKFDCGNGKTVPGHFVCDGDDNCENGADERTCRDGRFVCRKGRSVQRFLVCNGVDDCGNGKDERKCTPEILVPENPVSSNAQNSEHTRRSRYRREVIAIILKEEANIQSPGYPIYYPHNLDVLWNVSSAPGHRIKLVFRVKELEDSRNCTADRLSLYDGHELFSPSLGVYCRNNENQLPDPVVSTSNAMVVQFISDYSIRWQGFDLVLSTVCGGLLLAQTTEKVLVSHSKFGDEPYGENITCDWIIRSRLEKNVELTFSDFDVGTAFQSTDDDVLRAKVEVSGCEDSHSGECVQYNVPDENGGKDFVEIYDGPDDSSNLIGRYSGSQLPTTVTSRGEELLIRFRSGNSDNYRGFRAMYKEL